MSQRLGKQLPLGASPSSSRNVFQKNSSSWVTSKVRGSGRADNSQLTLFEEANDLPRNKHNQVSGECYQRSRLSFTGLWHLSELPYHAKGEGGCRNNKAMFYFLHSKRSSKKHLDCGFDLYIFTYPFQKTPDKSCRLEFVCDLQLATMFIVLLIKKPKLKCFKGLHIRRLPHAVPYCVRFLFFFIFLNTTRNR